MARLSEAEKLARVHSDALTAFDRIQYALHDERKQCLQDRRFYSISGAQWEGALAEQFENRPQLEVNKVHLSVIRIINEYRNNRITVDFTPKDGSADDKLADTCDGLYRADEQDSSADEAYDNAFEEAVAGGFGAWRLRACYEDEYDDENERQRIKIEPVFDADSCVFFDLDAKRQDKADAKHCFVLSSITRDGFIEKYGKEALADWPKEISASTFDWCTPDAVFVAEYYRVEEDTETIYTYRGLDEQERKVTAAEIEQDESLEEVLLATGWKLAKQRDVKRRRVHKYLLSGNGVLEDCGRIAGNCIPIVPVYGKRWFIDGVERCMGHVRLAKDAQRLKNMQLSKLGEISALSSVSKPIVTPEQIAGHQVMWSEDNVRNYPYLLINTMTDQNGQPMPAGPLAYTKPPEIPPALAALLQISDADINEVLGNQQAGEQLQPNLSGKAVELIQQKLDMQTFIYVSNMAKAVKRSGEIWLGMAKEIFVEEGRKLKTIGPQGEQSAVELLRPVLDPKTGAIEYENDLSRASLDVWVSVGPSSSSKRAATVRAITGLMTISQDPETLSVLGAMAMLNMEGEGIDEVREFYRRKLLRMGAIKPTQDEAQDLAQEAQQQQPDPQALYLQSAAAQAQAEAEKAKANSLLAVAKAEEARAKTASTLAGIDRDDRAQLVKTVEVIQKGDVQRPEPKPAPQPAAYAATTTTAPVRPNWTRGAGNVR